MPTSPELRAKRRQAILAILERQPVARQSELVALLRAEGLDATQSSVSRDLRELGIGKVGEQYARLQDENAAPGLTELPAGFVRELRSAGPNLTVVLTATGAAQRVALYLDRSEWPEIVGTVSGDDTIFVATRNQKDQQQLQARLRSTLQH